MSLIERATVRQARTRADWQAVRELCCRTGNGGSPIEARRWRFFADVWIGPYQTLVPEWTYVAETGNGIVGYLTGCPDTTAFQRARRGAVTVPLLLRVARGAYGWSADVRRFVRQAVGLETGPERRTRLALPLDPAREYPAHLHMNVEARWRGRGLGRQLIEHYVADLHAAHVHGVHVFCGAAARGFYARLRFVDLGSLSLRPGVEVYALGRPLGV